MAFRWLAMTRRGSWISFRKFVLEEKRDISARILAMETELDRIGTLFVSYEKEDDTKRATQRRKRLFVSKGSTLEKLLKVYISMGGNPLDISMFITPKDIELVRTNGETFYENTAMGGVVAPLSGSPQEEVFTGGWLNWNKDPKWQIGNADIPAAKQMWALHTVKKSRGWVEKEIRTKRNKIEEKIIKICDLAEQLETEKELLELRTREFDPLNKVGQFSSQQSLEYPIHLIDLIFWRQTDGVNGDPNDPRLLKKDDIYQTKEDIASNRDIQIRTHHMNFWEDASGEEYPITNL